MWPCIIEEKNNKKYYRSHSEDKFLYDTKSYLSYIYIYILPICLSIYIYNRCLEVTESWSCLSFLHFCFLVCGLLGGKGGIKSKSHSFYMMCSIAFISIHCSVKHTYRETTDLAGKWQNKLIECMFHAHKIGIKKTNEAAHEVYHQWQMTGLPVTTFSEKANTETLK